MNLLEMVHHPVLMPFPLQGEENFRFNIESPIDWCQSLLLAVVSITLESSQAL